MGVNITCELISLGGKRGFLNGKSYWSLSVVGRGQARLLEKRGLCINLVKQNLDREGKIQKRQSGI